MKEKRTAYFCMEYGLDESFRIYSGGLGILAGDILKAAKDLNKPLVGIGILWRQGYGSQIISKEKRAVDCFTEYSYDFLKDTGKKVSVRIRGQKVTLKIWLCDCFSNAPLYLLDANLPENADRLITGQLYGWFSEERIAQEMILGIGGVRALRVLGIETDVYHFNDSHPMFAGFELIRERMKEAMSFEQAFDTVRNSIVFTTHTPVEAGNEVHSLRLLRYMGAFNTLTGNQVKAIGGDPFNMTVAGLRMSCISNAVAKLHGKTARKMWENVGNSAPIISVTNGVHNATWQDAEIYRAFKEKSGIREAHLSAKRRMLAEIEKRTSVSLSEDVLTVGFARRAAPYKRGDLIFSCPEIIEPLLESGKIQLIFSGKAHPNDLEGKKIVEKLYGYSEKYPKAVVFVQDYDMAVGKMLTRGCDVWLNTPRRPMEASGTSGMKAAMNGVLNFSVLDGWWPEGCEDSVNGWQIGNGRTGKNADAQDAQSLYETLTQKIIPTYYDAPERWTAMMYASVEMATERFSAARMVEDYYKKMYSKCKDVKQK